MKPDCSTRNFQEDRRHSRRRPELQHAGQPAIHVDAATRDIARRIRCQKRDHVGDFFRFAHALERHGLAGIRIMLLDGLVVTCSTAFLLLRLDLADRNHVDQDIVWSEFFRQALGQRQPSGTADRGRKHRRTRLFRTDHVQIDDAATALLFHVRHGCTRSAHLRHDLDFDVVIPGLVVDFVESQLARTAGVVDDNIEASEMFRGLFDETFHVAFLGCIGHHPQHIATLLFQFIGKGFNQFGTACTKRNLDAFRHQPTHGRAADTFGAAGHRRHFSFESEFHNVIPFVVFAVKGAIVTHHPPAQPLLTALLAALHCVTMIIAIPDDYHGLVDSLECMRLLADHDVRIYRDVAPPVIKLVENLRDADIIVPIRERTRFTRDIIKQLPNLKLFSQTGRSFHHIDVDACNDHGIAITAGQFASPFTVAEHTWALILASLRDVAHESDLMRKGIWRNSFYTGLHGRTLCILGLGVIGKLIAATGASFGMRIVVWGRENSLAAARAAGYETASSQDDLFEQADVLVVMVRLTKDTRGIVKASHLARMKPTALLVNTARAELIEHDALENALRTGKPGLAAVDVYENEPVQNGNHPLLKLDNTLCAAHSAWLERDSYDAYFGEAFANAVEFAAGRSVKILNAPKP